MSWIIKRGTLYWSMERVWVCSQSVAWRFCCREDALHVAQGVAGLGVRVVRLRARRA
jgi:hypothetical protein